MTPSTPKKQGQDYGLASEELPSSEGSRVAATAPDNSILFDLNEDDKEFLRTFREGRFVHWAIADGDESMAKLTRLGLVSAGWEGHAANKWFPTNAGYAVLGLIGFTAAKSGHTVAGLVRHWTHERIAAEQASEAAEAAEGEEAA